MGNLSWKCYSLLSNQHICGLQVRATLEKVRKRMYGDYDEMRQKIRQITQELSVSQCLGDVGLWRGDGAQCSFSVASVGRHLNLWCSLWAGSCFKWTEGILLQNKVYHLKDFFRARILFLISKYSLQVQEEDKEASCHHINYHCVYGASQWN